MMMSLGTYASKPFFGHCEPPEYVVKLITITALSKYVFIIVLVYLCHKKWWQYFQLHCTDKIHTNLLKSCPYFFDGNDLLVS